MKDSTFLLSRPVLCRIGSLQFRTLRTARFRELLWVLPQETTQNQCPRSFWNPKVWKSNLHININENCYKISWNWFYSTYLVMATIGIHSTETSMRNTANTMHQWGHSKGSVTPLMAFHAGYLLPSDASSMKEAINIVIMAIGDTYFQHTIQYMLGREPVISSMSSANLFWNRS